MHIYIYICMCICMHMQEGRSCIGSRVGVGPGRGGAENNIKQQNQTASTTNTSGRHHFPSHYTPREFHDAVRGPPCPHSDPELVGPFLRPYLLCRPSKRKICEHDQWFLSNRGFIRPFLTRICAPKSPWRGGSQRDTPEAVLSSSSVDRRE